MHINFSQLSENLARRHGAAECLVQAERGLCYSYLEFHRLTNRIVNMMRERLGLRRGDCWHNILHNDHAALLGVVTACKGEPAVSLSHASHTLLEQVRVLEQVQPRVVFIEAELLPTHYALLKDFRLTIVSMDRPPPGFPDVLHFWDLLDGISDDNPDIVHDDRQDCQVLCADGAGRIALYTIDNWLAGVDLHHALPDALPFDGARLLLAGPAGARSELLRLVTLLRGGCTVTLNECDLAAWCDTARAERVNAAHVPAAMLARLAQAEPELPALRQVYYDDGALSPDCLAALHDCLGAAFIQLYAGAGHCGAISCLSRADHRLPGQDGADQHVLAGCPLPGVDLFVVDGNGQRARAGEAGEIWVRSRAAPAGQMPWAVRAPPAALAGYWPLGDRGYLDADGWLHVARERMAAAGVPHAGGITAVAP